VELAYAYATIASGGIRYDPFPLFSATTAAGEILTAAKVRWERALDPRAAYLTGYAMQGVLERGTAKSAKEMGIYFPASGKTGTTDRNRDSCSSASPGRRLRVWVGYDSGADTGLTGAKGGSGSGALPARPLPGSGPVTLRTPTGSSSRRSTRSPDSSPPPRARRRCGRRTFPERRRRNRVPSTR